MSGLISSTEQLVFALIASPAAPPFAASSAAVSLYWDGYGKESAYI